MREDFKLVNVKEYNSDHLDLYRLVKENGGPPRGKGTVAFWKGILKIWKDVNN